MVASLTETAVDSGFSFERFKQMQRLEEILEHPAASSSLKVDSMIGIIHLHLKNGCYLQAEENITRAVLYAQQYGISHEQFKMLESQIGLVKSKQRVYGLLYGMHHGKNHRDTEPSRMLGYLNVDKEVKSLANWVSQQEPR